MSETKYKKAAQVIVKAGQFPFPVNDTLIDILKLAIDEEDLDFVMAFRKTTTQTMEQLKENSKMSEEEILKHAEKLAKVGLIFNQPSSQGVMVYRLMPLVMVGLFEYLFMKKLEHTEKEREIAELFSKLFAELTNFVQGGYDTIVPIYQKMSPYDRTIPILDKTVKGEEIKISINESIEVPEEQVLTTQKVEEIIEKFDDIAVGHCFCRHHKDLLGHSCKQTNLRENCFTFGKSARYCADQGFARLISKEEALEILKQSEAAGLIHKAFYPHSDITKDETSVCNCCKDCCGTLEWWRTGMIAMINWANYLSLVNPDACTGCGICVEKCPVGAIQLNDKNIAETNDQYCIGCGICAHFCPEGAISLLEGMRKVYVPPPRLRK
jgi:NAD-dependent dihydropyrimidine dehydrogenase PreA subunit